MEKDYKSHVGPREDYYERGVKQLAKIFDSGLKPHHRLADIGCGSLRLGRTLIPFLDEGKYFGLEPQFDVVEEGLEWELSERMVKCKKPQFSDSKDFDFGGRTFDYAVASQVFIHCGVDQFKQCLKNLKTKFLYVNIRIGAKTLEEMNPKGRKKYTYSSHQCVEYSESVFLDTISEFGYKIEIRWKGRPQEFDDWAIKLPPSPSGFLLKK
jgi:SAM-dependent methyltransferase